MVLTNEAVFQGSDQLIPVDATIPIPLLPNTMVLATVPDAPIPPFIPPTFPMYIPASISESGPQLAALPSEEELETSGTFIAG